MIEGHQLERCQRSLPLGMIALQAAHASAHLGQAIVPALALEQIPKRVRIEDADIPACARDLHRVMAAGDVEQAADRVDGVRLMTRQMRTKAEQWARGFESEFERWT